jgi:uroporphyrinogen-III decarboxylase
MSRQQRFVDAVTLQGPDRVPVIPINVHFFDALQAGLSHEAAMYRLQERYRVWKDFVLEYGFDMAPVMGTFPAQLLDILGATYFKWPGGQLSSHQPFQYVEQEYMLQEEYPRLLADPADFTRRVIWPRKAKALVPLAKMPPAHWMGFDPAMLAAYMADHEMVAALQAMIRMGEIYHDWMILDRQYASEIEEAGFPLTYGVGYGHTAFDLLADYYRGLKGIMLDMYRVPDKLLAAIEVFTDMLIASLISDAKRVPGNPRIPIWLHRGQRSFMSQEQYEKFYWPSLRKLLIALVDAGLTPIPFLQGDNTVRLPYFTELPKGKVPLHFDVVDREAARKVIGDYQCFWGNVPASLLVAGTPSQVKEDVKNLINLFGDTGGLIIDSSSAIPDEAKPGNLVAMLEAVHEFGVSS